jgi:ABC-type spermidine/putrescine transport system permease subunit II
MEDVGIVYGHLVYFTAIWYVLWPFRIFYGHLVYFSPFWYVAQKENLATPLETSYSKFPKLATLIGIPEPV